MENRKMTAFASVRSVLSTIVLAFFVAGGLSAGERRPRPNTDDADLADASTKLIAEFEFAQSAVGNSLSRTFMPKVTAIVEQMNTLRRELAQNPDRKQSEKVSNLGTDLFMVLQDAKFCVTDEGYLAGKCTSALASFKDIRGRVKLEQLKPETQALAAKAEALIPKVLELARKPVVPAAQPAGPSELQLRDEAEMDNDFARLRKMLVTENAKYVELGPKVETLKKSVASQKISNEAKHARHKEMYERSQKLTGDEHERLNKQIETLWTTIMKDDNELNESENKLRVAQSDYNNALGEIKNACRDMMILASRTPYAKKLFNDPQKKLPLETKWISKPAKLIVMKNGNVIEAKSVQDLGGMLHVKTVLDEPLELDKHDVSAVKDWSSQ